MQIRSGFSPFDKSYYDSSFKHTYIGQHRTESFEIKLLSLGVLLTHKKNKKHIVCKAFSLWIENDERPIGAATYEHRARRCES
jgi:hypothetical protein